MKTISILIVGAFASIGLANAQQSWGDASGKQHATNTVAIPGHFYVIDYDYDTSSVTIPLTNPPGVPHYYADIHVAEIVNGIKVPVGKGKASGTYTEGKCWEDLPETAVMGALTDANSLTPEIDKQLQELSAKRAFEKQPLFEQYAREFHVTARGARDMDRVIVDGAVVWTRPGYVEPETDSRALLYADPGTWMDWHPQYKESSGDIPDTPPSGSGVLLDNVSVCLRVNSDHTLTAINCPKEK